MERRRSETLNDVLSRFMREVGLEMPLNEYRLLQAWPKVAGKLVSKQTTNLYIRNQTLHVYISSPALRSNLMMERSRLVQMLNQEVKADVITSISFH